MAEPQIKHLLAQSPELVPSDPSLEVQRGPGEASTSVLQVRMWEELPARLCSSKALQAPVETSLSPTSRLRQGQLCWDRVDPSSGSTGVSEAAVPVHPVPRESAARFWPQQSRRSG